MTKDELFTILSDFDFSRAIVNKVPGKQLQLGNIKENIKLWEEFNQQNPWIFQDRLSFMKFLVDRTNFSLKEIIDNSFCPICDKFTYNLSMKDMKHHCCCREHQYEYAHRQYEKKTGYKSPWENPDVILKRRELFQIKHNGASTPMEVEEYKQKNIENNKANHGGILAVQTQKIKDQIMETNKRNHNGTFNLLLPETKEKLKIASLEKFNVDCPLKSKKVRNLLIDKYDGYGCQSQIIRNKMILTHGCDPSNDPIVKQKVKRAIEEKYGGFSNMLKSDEVSSKIRMTNLSNYGIEYYVLSDECISKSKISKVNISLADTFKSLGYNVEFEKVIGNRSYDLFIDELNLVIEINPTFTHNSSKPSVFNNKILDKFYHQNKVKLAVSHNYKCFMIWDWDNIEKIKNYFNKDFTIKQNTKIRNVSLKDTKLFLDKYLFYQYELNENSVSFGAYYDNILVELINFVCMNKDKNTWELSYHCCCNVKLNHFNKLFHKFINLYNPSFITFNCNADKKLYNYEDYNLLKSSFNEPKEHWSYRSKQLDEKDLRCLKEQNVHYEEELINDNWLKVYDCGNIKYIWNP